MEQENEEIFYDSTVEADLYFDKEYNSPIMVCVENNSKSDQAVAIFSKNISDNENIIITCPYETMTYAILQQMVDKFVHDICLLKVSNQTLHAPHLRVDFVIKNGVLTLQKGVKDKWFSTHSICIQYDEIDNVNHPVGSIFTQKCKFKLSKGLTIKFTMAAKTQLLFYFYPKK